MKLKQVNIKIIVGTLFELKYSIIFETLFKVRLMVDTLKVLTKTHI